MNLLNMQYIRSLISLCIGMDLDFFQINNVLFLHSILFLCWTLISFHPTTSSVLILPILIRKNSKHHYPSLRRKRKEYKLADIHQNRERKFQFHHLSTKQHSYSQFTSRHGMRGEGRSSFNKCLTTRDYQINSHTWKVCEKAFFEWHSLTQHLSYW